MELRLRAGTFGASPQLSAVGKRLLWQACAAAALFSLLWLPASLLTLRGLRQPFLSQYVSFDQHFSVVDSLLRLLLVAGLFSYCLGVGSYLARKLGLDLPASFEAGIGVAALNMLLIPLFFLHWYDPARLLVGFLLLGWVAGKGVLERFYARPKWASPKNLLGAAIVAAALSPHLMNALLPVDYSESSGDIAMHYLRAPMYFAAAHGAIQTPLIGSVVAGLVNFEVVASALIVLANPEIVKLFGLMLFALTFWILFDFCRRVLRVKWSLGISLLLLVSPFILDRDLFSFAHPRVYTMLLASLALFLTMLGRTRQQPRYHLAALVVVGVLAGANYQGLLAAGLTSLLILADFRIWKSEWGRIVPACALAAVLAAIHPLWVYAVQGSPLPWLASLNQALGLSVNPEFTNSWVLQRDAFLFRPTAPITLPSVLGNLVVMIYEQLGVASLFLVAGAFLWRDARVRLLLGYYLSYAVLMHLLFPTDANQFFSRLQLIVLPALLAGLAYVMQRTQTLGESALLKRPALGRWVRQFISLWHLLWPPVLWRGFCILALLGMTILLPDVTLSLLTDTTGLVLFFLLYLLGSLAVLMALLPYSTARVKLSSSENGASVLSVARAPGAGLKNFWSLYLVNFALSGLVFVYLFHDPFVYNLMGHTVSVVEYLNAREWLPFLPIAFVPVDVLFGWLIELKKSRPLAAPANVSRYIAAAWAFVLLFSVLVVSTHALARVSEDSGGRAFLTGQIDLATYLRSPNTAIAEYLNSTLDPADKVLYVIQGKGVYVKAELYQPTVVGAASILYRSLDPAFIMHQLQKLGLSELCVDNSGPLTAADLTTPLFEPRVAARYLIPLRTGVPQLYCFRLRYGGLGSEEQVDANLAQITDSGFYCFVNKSILEYDHRVVPSNPYSVKTLLQSYEPLDSRLCPTASTD